MSRMSKQVLLKLEKELTASPEYSQQFETRVNQHFAGIWNPEFLLPKVDEVRFFLSMRNLQVELTAQVDVQFDGLSKYYTGKASMPFRGDTNGTEEALTQQFRALLPQLLQDACARMELPATEEEVIRYTATLCKKRLDRVAHEMERYPDVRRMLREKETAIRRDYERRLAKSRCPQGFQPAQIASLELRCSADANVGKCVLRVCMDRGGYSQNEVSFDLHYCYFYPSPERRREVLFGYIKENLGSLLRQVNEVPLLYTCPSLRDFHGMSEPLETFLLQGEASLGCVTVQWKRGPVEDALLLYRPERDRKKVRLRTSGRPISECPALQLYPGLLEQPLVPLRAYKTLPTDMVGVFRFGESIWASLEKAALEQNVDAPAVLLVMDRKRRLHFVWRTIDVLLDPPERDDEGTLQELMEQICLAERAKPYEKRAQLKVLNTLNPTELAVLRYIAANGETWYSALASAIDGLVCTTKVYTGTCLEHLTKVEILIDGDRKPLVAVRWVDSRKHDAFRMYGMGGQIDHDVLDEATGKPFEAADVEHMKPAERGKWFTRYLLEAPEEQRWTRFNEALECMPSTFLASFAKSDEGQAFLQSFSGDDAVFVRLTVEGLPGCKRLADKLWPEKE